MANARGGIMKEKLILKQVLPVIDTNSWLRDTSGNYLVNSLSYREVIDFLECEVVDILADGCGTIKITINVGENKK